MAATANVRCWVSSALSSPNALITVIVRLPYRVIFLEFCSDRLEEHGPLGVVQVTLGCSGQLSILSLAQLIGATT